MSIDNKFAVLVHACDRYEFLYQGFHIFFQKYWDRSIPCTCYFASEEKDVNLTGFTNIKSGKGEWSDRLRTVLKQIPEQHIIYFQEDMWLSKPVNRTFFEELFLLFQKNSLKQVKLHSARVYKVEPTGDYISGLSVSKLNNELSAYLMSHQVTLWDKEFLISQLPPKEHPWRNERKGTKRMRKRNLEIFHLDYFSENGVPPIGKNKDIGIRSEYYSVSLNARLNDHVLPFIEELKGSSHFDYAEKLEYNYKNQLTHDGKGEPRKKDWFKMLKNLFKRS
ncbi:MAG: hypothetical protein ACK4ND_01420 [Cytophagaceae bacterium]